MISVFIDLLPSGLQQGLLLAIVATGIAIAFRLLNFADLTPEGTYTLGGSVYASLIILGVNPILATTIAVLFGGLIGIITAFLHIRLKIDTLLAGIILSTMLYSVNLRLMGKPNIALFDQHNLFSCFPQTLLFKISLLLLICLIIAALSYFFLNTEKGLRFRSVGLNPEFAEKQGTNVNLYIMLGLFAGNGLASLAGSLTVQVQEYADIGMGIGIVIHALAALMIGESVIGNDSMLKVVSAPIIGALIYQQIQGLALAIGFAPSDLKLVTGLIVLITLGCKAARRKSKL
ncbi:ABC transporter permease [endosymbiont of Acanthamoeba sp. UWC8]|uniref:ABC transporter permease n=1 Tax=endosymbiont of Acanthamoeba sp. UWC8 TaxID=86106 RepID=UPI0004D1DB19|nr:ABC transporter permease [endosymbiont of Acanthamoeba sp. UWC8]AIF80583.1 ABC transporter permease [endosymbiont of Acanthamoeba sp. UWC8]